MRRKLLTAAAKTAVAAGGAAVLCLGGAHAALAMPMHHDHDYVSCHGDALSTAISDASSGATLALNPDCTYVLTSALPNIDTTLTIDGNGATVERSYDRDTPDFTIIDVEDDGDLTLNDVNVRHGGGEGDEDYGGAISSDGEVTIDGGTYSDNVDPNEWGGAIANDGEMAIENATFLDNSSAVGGAIVNGDNLTVTSTTFTGNSATEEGGGAIANDGGTEVADSTFTDNTTDGSGGGIGNETELEVTGSTFTGNQAEGGGGIANGGGAELTGDTFTGNGAAYGGGFANANEATVDDSSFTDNGAYYGGGIDSYVDEDEATLEVDHSELSHNSATDSGGGIYNEAPLTTGDDTSIKGNSAGVDGGGIYNWEDTSVTLNDTHVSGNHPENCTSGVTITGCHN